MVQTEARAAIAFGKQPTKTGLVVAAGGEQFTLGFDAVRFSVTGLKLPEIEEPSAAARLEERCMHMTRCAALLDALYAAFLKERLSGRYAPKLAAAIRAWQAVSTDPKLLIGKTVKQALQKWLRINADRFELIKEDGSPNEQGIEEIAKICNWDTKGGPAKTPG